MFCHLILQIIKKTVENTVYEFFLIFLFKFASDYFVHESANRVSKYPSHKQRFIFKCLLSLLFNNKNVDVIKGFYQ